LKDFSLSAKRQGDWPELSATLVSVGEGLKPSEIAAKPYGITNIRNVNQMKKKTAQNL
jgi:hypothetical protein